MISIGGWRKATASNNGGDCVELKFTDGKVLVRDSKYLRDPANDPATAPMITIPLSSWRSFLNRVAAPEEHHVEDRRLPLIERNADGSTSLIAADSVLLSYTVREWEAFTDGVLRGEFDCEPGLLPV